MKLALLSNVNTDYVLRILSSRVDCAPSVGYGDIWSHLLNECSELNKFDPDMVVIIIEIEQLVTGYSNDSEKKNIIEDWFSVFDRVINAGKEYFISDAVFHSRNIDEYDSFSEYKILNSWMNALQRRVCVHTNVHILKICSEFKTAGLKNVFSDKMWYMGKIPYTNEGCRIIADEIMKAVVLPTRITKKVIILDMDNTLWGGVLGESGLDGISLSDDGIGAIYKKIQQMIRAMRATGVLLAVVSKNNYEDVQELWERHPHMILKKEDFISVKINWNDKAESIREIADELNLGMDSFVFIDDMASERDNIRLRLPAVTVPEFPDSVEEYISFMEEIFDKYFRRLRLTDEDKEKTRQYSENSQRKAAETGLTYEEFLESLRLEVSRVDLNEARLDRIAQLHGKTNQFNLTTKRYTRVDIDKLRQKGDFIFAYNVKDKFGDYGLVAVAIVDDETAEIKSFLMSCRVMGKMIENYIINDIENEMKRQGRQFIKAVYKRTDKNKPVENFYDGMGYEVILKTENRTEYRIDLKKCPRRVYFVNEDREV